MLIKALCDYYDYTDSKGENQTKDHLTEQNVHYMIMLTDDGEISEIVDIREEKEIMQKNKKTKIVLNPVIAKLPKRTQKSGIDVNIVEHRPLYIFGLNYDKGVFTPNDRTEKAKKSHLCFSEANLDFFSDLKSDIAKAYCLFIQNWEPEEQCENPFLLELGKNYSNSYFTFGLSGHPESPLHMNTELLDKFQKKYEVKAKEENDTADMLMCPIEGQLLPTARIHNKISGFRGGNSTGCVLVGFKESAFESYGKTQAFNSGISITAMNKYTSTLNKLISDKRHRIFLDDMTVVFFAMSNNDENECDIFSYLMTGDQVDKLNNNLESVASDMILGRVSDLTKFSVDENVIFCMSGLTPNSSRISQKFCYLNKFGDIITNLIQHQRDMSVNDEGKQIPLYRIYRELVSPKSTTDKVPPPLSSAILQAILYGTRYPNALLSTVVRRIKVDEDDDKSKYIKLNNIRVGIIKACINRNSRLSGNEEEISMALNKENTNLAYQCGRLFAILEYIQKRSVEETSNSTLNRTIKDSYFASACSRPSVVLPRLIMLSQNHLKKIKAEGYFNMLLGDVITMIDDEFPQTLSMEEQGKFIIGYYHQNKDLYTKKEKENND